MILLTKTPENPMINKSLNLPEGEGFRFNSPQYPEFYNSSRGFWRSPPRISWFLGIVWLSRRAIAVTAIVFRENLATEDWTSHGKSLVLAHLTGLKCLDDKKSFPQIRSLPPNLLNKGYFQSRKALVSNHFKLHYMEQFGRTYDFNL